MIIEGKKSKEEKENMAKEIYDINNSIEAMHEKINEFNPKTTLNKNYSLNMELIKILIRELNTKKEEKFDPEDIYPIILQLIDKIIFNQIGSSLYEQIFNFIENYFFKNANANLIKKLFEYLVKIYINKENKYRNVTTIIGNKIWILFDVKLFIDELKICFS